MTRRYGSHACLALALALTTLTWAAPSRAQDTKDLESVLDEGVVTSASTTPQAASVAPATSTTITAEQLHQYGLRSLSEAIDFLSLGVMTSDPLRTPDIGAGGVLLSQDNGKHFLLQIDGHAMNDPLYGAARFDQGAGVPIEVIDHIEVIVGPGSVLYGSDAMMGVINVVTKRASGFRGGHVTGEYEPDRSWRASAGGGFTLKLFDERLEVTAAAQYYRRFGPELQFPLEQFPFTDTAYRRGGPPDGLWGGTVAGAYFVEAPSGLVHLRWGKFEVELQASSYRRGIPYSTQTISVDFDDPDSYEDDHALRLNVTHDSALNSFIRLRSRLYGDLVGFQRKVNGVSTNACVRGLGTDTCTLHDVGLARWVGLEERLAANWLMDGSLVTTLGVDGRVNWVQAKEDEFDFATGAPLGPSLGRLDATNFLVSPYLEQTWSPASWLDMNAGVRLDVDSRYSAVASPRAAVAVRPFGPDTTLKAIYAEAFRAPTYSEANLSNYRLAPPNPLQPEKVRSIQGMIEERFARQHLTFGVFRTWWVNLIELGPLSADDQARFQREGLLPNFVPAGILQYGNVYSLDNYGLNASWDGSLGGLRYGADFTEAYTRRVVVGESEPLPIAPQAFGNAHVAYAAGGYVPTVGLAAFYMGSRPADRPLTPGAPIVDAPPLGVFRLTLTGALPLPGLSYRLSASVSTASSGPYTAGPNIAYTANGTPLAMPPPLGFAPIDQFNAFGGLTYDFATGGGP